MNVPLFENIIKSHCGLTFDGTRSQVLEKVVLERMAMLNLASPEAYAVLIQTSSLEMETLVSHLTINETYFLREPASIDLLTERLFPEIMAHKAAGERIVILSAGCATGEEPYSLAIRLLEKFGPAIVNFTTIIGIDVDVRALAIARKGIYGRHSFRGVPPEFKNKYFDKVEKNLFQIKECFRKQVDFRACNLLKIKELQDIGAPIDIVFYRNVSIYFNDPVRRSIFENFSSVLSEGGYLVVSFIEILHHDFGILSLNEENGVFFFQKSLQLKFQERRKWRGPAVEPKKRPDRLPASKTGPMARLDQTPVEKSIVPPSATGLPDRVADREPALVVDARQQQRNTLFAQALALALQRKFAEALPIIRRFVQENATVTAGYALLAAVLIELRNHAEAKTVCRTVLQLEPWHIEARLLLGLVARQEADAKEAQAQFMEASYLDPKCWLAHFYLAETYRTVGNRPLAIQEYRISENILKNGGKPNHGLTLFPLACSAEQLLHLCSTSIMRL
ncbi:MAG: hypothetical protein HQL87_10485 [Magnetococcales bacterium]|nr:hypothetical protein [Magnetococcales bacterium]